MNKTIAAISTPFGTGGIAIIRMSGGKAIEIAKNIFSNAHTLNEVPSHTLTLGYIIDENKEHIDRAFVTIMNAPKTYTGEDVVEINIHGGTVVAKRVLDLCIKNGATLAEPGEFTKRAFLNGKLDLSEAEAVIDTINAETVIEQKCASSQLEGRLSNSVEEIRSSLIHLSASMQVAIDYPDEELEDVTLDDIKYELSTINNKIVELIDSAEQGRIVKQGIKTAIVGKPNVGKSSLLNKLCGEQKAIVTNIAGTTRDVIEQTVNLSGVKLNLLDTAGIRDTDDSVEQIGVDLSKKAIDDAELVLIVLDATTGITPQDEAIISYCKNKNVILLVNKTDINTLVVDDSVQISALTGQGIDDLATKINNLYNLNELNPTTDILVTNLRHKSALMHANKSLNNALSNLSLGIEQDLVTIDMNEALFALGEITGSSVSDDIVNEIFHKFCVGK